MEESFAAQMIAYHEASKHHYRTYAPGPGYLDWATQPDPFRRYTGAQVIPLARPAPDDDLPYEAGFMPGLAPVAPLDAASVSRLFFDTLALSAWKEYGDERWALRVNPSSGNLHPTEGYLICGAASRAERCADRRALRPGRAQPGGAGAADPAHLAGAARGGCVQPGRWSAGRDDLRRPDLDPLARGVEVRRPRVPLLPARRGSRAGRAGHRRGRAGLAGAAAR